MSLRTFGGSPCGPTPSGTALGQAPQIARRRLALRNELVRIFVAQLRRARTPRARVSRETRAAARRDNAARARRRPQAALGVRLQLEAELVERSLEANGGQRVLQHAALAAVHVHVAGGDQRHAELRAERLAHSWSRRRSLPPCEQLRRQPDSAFESLLQPAAGREQRGPVCAVLLGNPEQHAPRIRDALGEVVAA